jgi:branched-chain amino acid transport system permease protein
MTTSYLAQQALNAGQVSAFYGLLAVAYVLIHAITRRINLAFGALSIWAGYTLINTALWLMLELPGATAVPVVAASLVAIAHTVLAGAVVQRLVVGPLVRETSLAMLVATLGLAIAMEEVMRLANDSRERWLMPIAASAIRLGGVPEFPVQVTAIQVVVVAAALALAGALILLVERHSFGRVWRACSDDLGMAELCGVDVGRALWVTFALATACAAAAGILHALSYGVASYYGGFVIGLKTLFVAIVGGLGSVPGALVGGVILGVFETLWSAYVGPAYRDAAAFIALSGLMILFPRGLFDGQGRVDPV